MNVVDITELFLALNVEADTFVIYCDRRTFSTVHHELATHYLIPVKIEMAEIAFRNLLYFVL